MCNLSLISWNLEINVLGRVILNLLAIGDLERRLVRAWHVGTNTRFFLDVQAHVVEG